MWIALRLGIALFALSRTASAASYHRTVTLEDATGAAESHFGVAIAASPGGGVVVGAPSADVGSAQSFDAISGAPQQTFSSPDDSASFGRAVAATATDILIGDAGVLTDDSGTAFGVVYRFDPMGGLLGTFISPSPDASFAFGSTIAVRDGELLVRDTQAIDRFDVASGALLGTLPAPAGASTDFGLALAGNAAAVFVGDPTAQRVYVFDAASGALLQTLSLPPGAAAGRFGTSLALLGGDLLVGAPGGVGAVFQVEPVSAVIRATFDDPLGTPDVGFGNAVAVLGDAVVVGAPSVSLSESGIHDGAAFMFDAATQALIAVLARESPDFLDAFGAALAPAAQQIFVGIPHEDAAQVEAFALDCGGAADCRAADAAVALRSARIAAASVAVRATLHATAVEFDALRAGAEACLIGPDGPIACTAWDDSICTGGAGAFRCSTDEGDVTARRSHRGRVRLALTATTIDSATSPPDHVVLRLTLGGGDGVDPTRAGAARKCRVRRGIGHCR